MVEGRVGTLIGFAADPGKAALDGERGGHSPYAAALLRHLSALQGMEFGHVMRLVTEEVYLKTRMAQRPPWVSESLTRFLYFGSPLVIGEQALIDDERRPLLLMIANLPYERRRRSRLSHKPKEFISIHSMACFARSANPTFPQTMKFSTKF